MTSSLSPPPSGAVAALPSVGERDARKFAARAHSVLIGGPLQMTPGAKLIAVEHPATEEPLDEVPIADSGTVDRAVASAREAFEDRRWRHLGPAEQEAALRRLAALILRHADELAWLDSGKTMAEARGDVGGTAAVFNYYAGWPTRLRGDVHATDRRFLAISIAEPVGVCAQIIPWNYPLLMASWKVGPALAGGNAIVLKPAEQTPLSALRLAELSLESGIPPGICNVITGDGSTGAAMSAHPRGQIAFTGSTEVGHKVMAAAAGTIKRVRSSSAARTTTSSMPTQTLPPPSRAPSRGRSRTAGKPASPEAGCSSSVACRMSSSSGWPRAPTRSVWVNAYGVIRPEVPFGGFGESGLGRELGAHGLAAHTELKSIFFDSGNVPHSTSGA